MRLKKIPKLISILLISICFCILLSSSLRSSEINHYGKIDPILAMAYHSHTSPAQDSNLTKSVGDSILISTMPFSLSEKLNK